MALTVGASLQKDLELVAMILKFLAKRAYYVSDEGVE